jgi:hypothetical protein
VLALPHMEDDLRFKGGGFFFFFFFFFFLNSNFNFFY